MSAPGSATPPAGRFSRLIGLKRGLQRYFRILFGRDTRHLKRIWYAVLGLMVSGVLGVVLLLVYAALLIPFTPSISDIRQSLVERPTVLMSTDGQVLGEFKQVNREWVPLAQISPHVVDALIATEDHRFYQHHGLDWRRVGGAMLLTLRGRPQGGSTITQQLARNAYDEVGRDRSLNRKLKEAITALKIESAYSKPQILEAYLNTVPFLYNAYGIEMASRTYFDKSAKKLNKLEAATLVGMLKGTSYYNPKLNPERSLERRNLVLSLMVKHGKLPEKEFASLRDKPLKLRFERQEVDDGNMLHAKQRLRDWLIKWADENDYNIYRDGLVVRTTIDSRLQRYAEQAVSRQGQALQQIATAEWRNPSPAQRALLDTLVRESDAFRQAMDQGEDEAPTLAKLKADTAFMAKLRDSKTRVEASFVALDPLNGQVRAWVGARDFAIDQFDHVASARRQPGSTFKPFVYAAALLKGMRPNDTLLDQAVEIPLDGGAVWRPRDAGAPSGQALTLAQGLAYSKNTITAQVMQRVGPKPVAELAQRLGVRQSPLEAVPALALGTSPVTLLEMVSSYGTIANGGQYHEPILVTAIEDRHGQVLENFVASSESVLAEDTAIALLEMMRGTVDYGTGRAIRSRFGVGGDLAGKTGTTQNNADGWFILMHPRLVGGAWVGFNDQRITFRSNYWGQGAHSALPVVGEVFRQAQQGRVLDAKARFPGVPEPGPGLIPSKALDEWLPLPSAAPPELGTGEDSGQRVLQDLGLGQATTPTPTPTEAGPQGQPQDRPQDRLPERVPDRPSDPPMLRTGPSLAPAGVPAAPATGLPSPSPRP